MLELKLWGISKIILAIFIKPITNIKFCKILKLNSKGL